MSDIRLNDKTMRARKIPRAPNNWRTSERFISLMRDIVLKKKGKKKHSRAQRGNSWRDAIAITFEKTTIVGKKKQQIERERSVHALVPLMLLARSRLRAASENIDWKIFNLRVSSISDRTSHNILQFLSYNLAMRWPCYNTELLEKTDAYIFKTEIVDFGHLNVTSRRKFFFKYTNNVDILTINL